MSENNKVFATYPSWPRLFISVQSNKNHERSENILIKTHEKNFFLPRGFLLDFYKVMVSPKMDGFPQKAFRIPDYKKDTDKLHHKLFLIGIVEKVAMKREWPSVARMCVTPYITSFWFRSMWRLCLNNLRCKESDLKIWQYLFFSERGVAGKLLIVPFQPFYSLD